MVARGAGDHAEVHFHGGDALPDERDEPAGEEPFAAHAFPEGGAPVGFWGPGAAGGRVEGQVDGDAFAVGQNLGERDVGVEVEEDAVL